MANLVAIALFSWYTDDQIATAVFPGYAAASGTPCLILDFPRQFWDNLRSKIEGRRILLPIPFRNVPGLTALFWDTVGRPRHCSNMYMAEMQLSYPSVFSAVPARPLANATLDVLQNMARYHNYELHDQASLTRWLRPVIPHMLLKFSIFSDRRNPDFMRPQLRPPFFTKFRFWLIAGTGSQLWLWPNQRPRLPSNFGMALPLLSRRVISSPSFLLSIWFLLQRFFTRSLARPCPVLPR